MKKASISYAKAHLSALLKRVREGQTVLITDRGTPVARLEPIADVDWDARMRSLAERGVVKLPKTPLTWERFEALPPAPVLPPGVSAVDYVIAEREEGW
jgi:prevent-host-death family protein